MKVGSTMSPRLCNPSPGKALVVLTVAAVSCVQAKIERPGNRPSAMEPGVPSDPSLLPSRIRRLSNAEYDHTVAALLGTSATPGKRFPTDIRQSDFSINAGQRVDPVLAGQLQAAARDLAAEALQRLLTSLPCAAASPGEACARDLIAAFAPQAFRRPVTDDEKADLLAVWRAGADGGSFADGVELVVTAVLQSASFLYLTELGAGAPTSGAVTLAPHELAASLSYMLTGGPPDRALLDAAAAGKLATAAERETQARRLLAAPGAVEQVQRMVKEWLKLDRLEHTGKDSNVYPRFEELRPHMLAETDAFIREVTWNDDGTLGTLLAAGYTVAPAPLGTFYGLSAAGTGVRSPIGASPRRGLLNQAAFLAVHGHDTESAPVIRGVTVLRKLLCETLPTPAELNLEVAVPRPDPKLTTRERFTVHAANAACRGCHDLIDPVGFAFEWADGMGGQRSMENGKPVDSRTDVQTPPDLKGPVADSNELAMKLAASAEAQRCFARNVFRFAAAQSGQGYEDLFLAGWEMLPADRRANLRELFVAFAASDVFARRAAP